MISPHFVDAAVQEYLTGTSDFVGDPDVAQCFAAGAVLALQHHVPDVRSIRCAAEILKIVCSEYRDCDSHQAITRFSSSLQSILKEDLQNTAVDRVHDRVIQTLCPAGLPPADLGEIPNFEDEALREFEDMVADGFDPVMQVDPTRNIVAFRHLQVPRPDLPRGDNP